MAKIKTKRAGRIPREVEAAGYPMIAPKYAAQRSGLAKRFGLVQLRGDGVKRKRGRPRTATA